jgi:hypothetical protein
MGLVLIKTFIGKRVKQAIYCATPAVSLLHRWFERMTIIRGHSVEIVDKAAGDRRWTGGR